MTEGDNGASNPQCIASTTNATLNHVFTPAYGRAERNCFRRSELSADGTTIVTYNADERLRTCILPADLLDNSASAPQQLDFYATSSPFKSHAFTLYPGFTLQDPSTTLILQSRVDLPIRLVNALSPDYAHATYPLVNPLTEAFNCPHSLTFTPDGARFVAGGKESISIFETSRSGAGPVTDFPTRPGRRARASYSGDSTVSLQGLVSALVIAPATGVLAAGSTGGQVALYDDGGAGERITSFEPGMARGVSNLRWDATGQHLLIAGRASDTIVVYDMRAGKRRTVLLGRKAKTTLGLGFEIVEAEEGYDVWAGGTDGCVRVWKNVTSRDGEISPERFMRLHDGAVSNVVMHPSRSVFMTTCGQWKGGLMGENDGDEEQEKHSAADPDVSLKAWTM